MSRLIRPALLLATAAAVVALLIATGMAADRPDVLSEEGVYRAAPTCTLDPPERALMYINEHGYWTIGPMASAGQATYLWRGDPDYRYTDMLTYLGRSTMTDTATGAVYHGWMYRASDWAGNAMFWFFSEAPVMGGSFMEEAIDYPLFYSLDRAPPHEAIFHRYLTPTGTMRIDCGESP